ncbi:hypothetical protein AVEN_194064-2-1, partial [Araneus ventricosus]
YGLVLFQITTAQNVLVRSAVAGEVLISWAPAVGKEICQWEKDTGSAFDRFEVAFFLLKSFKKDAMKSLPNNNRRSSGSKAFICRQKYHFLMNHIPIDSSLHLPLHEKVKKHLQVIQNNLQRAKIATTMLLKATQQYQPDLFIEQEPHAKDGKIAGIKKCWKSWLSKSGKAGIIALPTCSTPVVLSAKENTMAIKITKNSKAFTIISLYSSPYANFREIVEELTDLATNINGEEYLIGGDFNAHSQRWGYRDEDSRGKQLQEFIAEKHIFLLNSSDPPPTLNTTIDKAGPT